MDRVRLDFRIDQPNLHRFEFKIFMKNPTQKSTDQIKLNLQVLMDCQACQGIID